MITFLPVADFTQVARLLDNKRLNCQRMEALFILRCVRNVDGRRERFQNAGYVRMWAGYAEALAVYYNTICEEWVSRGFSMGISVLDPAAIGRTQADVTLPGWLGDERLHATHRAALLCKDPAHYGGHGWAEAPEVQYLWPLRAGDADQRWALVPAKGGRSLPSAVKRRGLKEQRERDHWMSKRKQGRRKQPSTSMRAFAVLKSGPALTIEL